MENMSILDTRWYGVGCKNQYTLTGTDFLPRPGCQNDTVVVAPGITGVILQDGNIALVDDEDYIRTRDTGWIGRWTARKVTGNNTYPSIHHGDKIRSLARVILDARKGERVRYRTLNRYDLTRKNLVLCGPHGIKINFDNRRSPIAPLVCKEEGRRAAARVALRVGTASKVEREEAARWASREAQPELLGARQSLCGSST